MKSLTRLALRNGPAMNIIMIAVMIVGLACTLLMRREDFPSFELELILVSVPYPQATPSEVEEGICQKIEEAVRTIEGVTKVTSVAAEGVGSVVLELSTRVADPDRVLDEVRAEVDRIPSFPLEAEDPVITRVAMKQPAIRVGVLGPQREGPDAELALRDVAEDVRNRLLLLPEVTQVDFIGARDYQIDIEISEDTLRAHNLSLQQVADIVRQENRQLPGGTLRSPSQEVLLRGDNRRITGDGIGELPLIKDGDGAVLRVADLANVRDQFADVTAISRVGSRPAMAIAVQKTNAEDMLSIVDAAKRFVAEQQDSLPPGYTLTTWGDRSVEVRGRIDLLLENGAQGLLLVFLLLSLFLELKLAFWVALGIPFSLLGTGIYLYFGDQTINMLSMFGFVMALGIVVDDAIVVGENIYAHRQMGKPFEQAAYEGTMEVVPSVTASVMTTVIAFTPLLFVTGVMGKFMAVMPVAIIGMLLVSLLEGITILPVHLAHKRSLLFAIFDRLFFVFRWIPWLFGFANRAAVRGLDWFIRQVYAPLLALALRRRVEFIALCLSVMIVAIGCVRAGFVPFSIFPKLDGNQLQCSVTFPDGTPPSVTDRWTRRIEEAILRVNERYRAGPGPVVDSVYRVVGQQVVASGPGQGQTSTGSNLGSVEVELVDVSERPASSQEIIAAWREEVGQVPGTEGLSFGAMNFGPGGIPIEFKLLADSQHVAQLEGAVELCKRKLAEYPGLFDIKDDSTAGKWELRLRVKKSAEAMGVTNGQLAETVRAHYYGAEVQRLQRGRHEVKLMVRYPPEERNQLANLDEVRVRTDDGVEHPLDELADVTIVRGYSEINRVDQLRSITVSSDLDETTDANAATIVAELKEEFMPQTLLAKFPDVKVRWEGQQQQTAESLMSLMTGLAIALQAMYVLLVFEFKSYLQPLLVMAVIPFGLVGAIGGHLLLQIPLTMFSLFGIVALTGIVVNDSIVLIDFINRAVRSGASVGEALLQSGQRRFRPVLLTTVTTVAGLLPIMLETSLQAQVLIPMAASIAFGEIFATVLVLFLLPVSYSIYADVLAGVRHLGRRRARNAIRDRRAAGIKKPRLGTLS